MITLSQESQAADAQLRLALAPVIGGETILLPEPTLEPSPGIVTATPEATYP